MGNNSWMDSPFFRDIWSHKTSETLFVFAIFSIFPWDQQKVNVLLTSPSNQFRDYSIWNCIEKLVPQHWNFAPQTLNTSKKTNQSVSKLYFFVKSGFPKTRDLSPAAPRGVYISRNDPPKKDDPIILANHQNRHFLTKWLPLFLFFLGPSWPGSLGPRKTWQKDKNRKFKKPYIKEVWG